MHFVTFHVSTCQDQQKKKNVSTCQGLFRVYLIPINTCHAGLKFKVSLYNLNLKLKSNQFVLLNIPKQWVDFYPYITNIKDGHFNGKDH